MTEFYFIDIYDVIDWDSFNSAQDVLFDDMHNGLISQNMHTDYGNTLVF